MSTAAAADSYSAIPASRRVIAGVVLALSNFMVVLDLTIANVSIPHIAGSMGITLEQGTWIITSYAVAEAICVPLTGWLALRFGAVRVFIGAMLGFGLFSLICGMSLTLGMIVAARIGQGLCGGPIMPMSQALMVRCFPPQQRAAAMGLWAMTVIMGPALGPILGGYISDELSWHWIFFINVPIAALCIAFAMLVLRRVETETERLPIDKVGLGLLVFWISSLQLMLDLGRDHDWFADWKIVALAIMAALGLVVFVIWELTEEHPVVDLHILRHRGLSASLISMSLAFGSFFASVVIVPQWLQIAMGYSAGQAGIMMGLQSAVSLVFAPVVARLMQHLDARILLSSGILWMAATTWMRSFWNTDADFWYLAIPLMLQGATIPFMMIPLTVIALNSVQPSETATAAGMQNFVRTLAIAVATAVVLTIWGDTQRVIRNGLVEKLSADQAMASLSAGGFTGDQGRMILSNLVDQQAMVMAMNHTSQLTAILLVVASATVWLIPRIKPGAEIAIGH